MSNPIHEAFPYLRVRDASAAIEFYKLAFGAVEPANQFHGERSSKVIDPFGHEWYLGSKIEYVSREEM